MVLQFRGRDKFSIFVSVSIRTQDRDMNVPTVPPPLMKKKQIKKYFKFSHF